MFNRKKKNKNKDKDKVDSLSQNEDAKDETEKPTIPTKTVYSEYLKIIKPLERKQKIKNIFLTALVIVGLIGGYKAFLPSKANQEALAASETQTFVKTYVINYFTYPSTKELDEYFSKYSLNTQWRNAFDNKVDRATPSNVEIYKVTPHEDDAMYTDYYLYLQENITLKENGGEASSVHDVKVTLYKDESGYMVASPITLSGLDIKNLDKKVKDGMQYKPETGKEQVDEQQKKEIENSVALFLNTYSTNFEQASLLVDDKNLLDKISRNSVLVLDSIRSCTKDATTFYIEASITESIGEHISNRKNMHFEINIEKNKITEMEEY